MFSPWFRQLQAPPNQGANHPYRAREAEGGAGCRGQGAGWTLWTKWTLWTLWTRWTLWTLWIEHSPLRLPHPAPCTLHPAPCTLHPAPRTLHPAPFTLHPAPRTLPPAPCTPHHAPCPLHPAPCTLDKSAPQGIVLTNSGFQARFAGDGL